MSLRKLIKEFPVLNLNRFVFRLLSTASMMFVLQGCNFNVSTPDSGTLTASGSAQITTTSTSSTALSCAASVPSGVTVVAGVPVNVNVVGSGGLAPYSFPGESATFTTNSAFPRSYSNDTSSSIVVQDQVTIQDSAGSQATCSFSVTVQPESAPPSSLTCTMVSSAMSIAVNNPVTLTVTSQGGVGTLTYGQLIPGTSGSFVAPFNPTTGIAQVAYSSPGQVSPSITVSDSAGNSAGCSTLVQVLPAPSVSITVSPSSTLPSGSIFTLTANPSNFVNPPTSYTFTPSSSAVTVIQSSPSSPTAQVSSSTLSSFQVTVVASNANETASRIQTLTYTPVALTCTLSHAAGTYFPGDTVTFTITASTGVPLTIFQVQAQDGSGYFVGSSVFAQFSSAGTKTVSVRARTASGQLCNNGADVQDSVVISSRSQLSCTAATNRNPAGVGQGFRATVSPSVNNGFTRITNITSIPTNLGFFEVLPNGLQADIAIFQSGTFNLTYMIRDALSGNRASCSASQTIR
jgi:hypothetical protein